MIVHLKSGNPVLPSRVQSENTVKVTIYFIMTYSFTYFWKTFCHSYHMLLREEYGFNIWSSKLDHGAVVLGRKESQQLRIGSCFRLWRRRDVPGLFWDRNLNSRVRGGNCIVELGGRGAYVLVPRHCRRRLLSAEDVFSLTSLDRMCGRWQNVTAFYTAETNMAVWHVIFWTQHMILFEIDNLTTCKRKARFELRKWYHKNCCKVEHSCIHV